MDKKGSFLLIFLTGVVLVFVAGSLLFYLSDYNKSDNLSSSTSLNLSSSLKNNSNISSANSSLINKENKLLCNGSNLARAFNNTNGSCGCIRVIDFEKYYYETEGTGTQVGTGISKFWILENNVKRVIYSESSLNGIIAKYWTITENGQTTSYLSSGGTCILTRGVDQMADDSQNIYGHNPLESMYLLDYAFYIDDYVTGESVTFKNQGALKMTASHLKYMDKAKLSLGGDTEISLDYFSTKFCVPLQMEMFMNGLDTKTSFYNIKVDNIDDSVFIPPSGCIEPMAGFS